MANYPPYKNQPWGVAAIDETCVNKIDNLLKNEKKYKQILLELIDKLNGISKDCVEIGFDEIQFGIEHFLVDGLKTVVDTSGVDDVDYLVLNEE